MPLYLHINIREKADYSCISYKIFSANIQKTCNFSTKSLFQNNLYSRYKINMYYSTIRYRNIPVFSIKLSFFFLFPSRDFTPLFYIIAEIIALLPVPVFFLLRHIYFKRVPISCKMFSEMTPAPPRATHFFWLKALRTVIWLGESSPGGRSRILDIPAAARTPPVRASGKSAPVAAYRTRPCGG